MSSFSVTPSAAPVTGADIPSNRTKPVYLVLGCTVFAAAAQVLLKFGAGHPMPELHPGQLSSVLGFLKALVTNWELVLGYSLHACNAFLLILALRDGELSLLYPIIALTYVWVNILSMYFFHERPNLWKAVGILLVIGGVGMLGRASRRAEGPVPAYE
jgi:drug/metabolite transporter (DMT)-like permease